MLIQGEGLDALILAYLLSEDGTAISLSGDLEQMGGHFKGFRHNDYWLDFGMVALEPSSRELLSKPIHEYEMQTGRELLPFLHQAFHCFQQRISSVKEISIATKLRDSSTVEDYFISDSLNVLKTLPDNVQRKILIELDINLERLAKSPNEHPSNKYESKYFEEKSIIQVLHETIGETATKELFSDFIDTLLAPNQEALKANSHRRAWVPLYWPETLRSVLTEVNSECFPRYSFAVPDSSTVAALLAKMKIKIDSANISNQEHEKGKSDSTLSVTSFKQHAASPNALTSSSDRVYSKVIVVHFCLDNGSDSVLFWQKPKNGCYRATIRKLEGGSIIALEFGSVSETNLLKLVDYGREIIEKMGLIITCAGLTKESRIPISIAVQNEPASISVSELQNREFKLEYLYPASSNSFNDNLVRAFHAYSFWRGKHD